LKDLGILLSSRILLKMWTKISDICSFIFLIKFIEIPSWGRISSHVGNNFNNFCLVIFLRYSDCLYLGSIEGMFSLLCDLEFIGFISPILVKYVLKVLAIRKGSVSDSCISY